MIEQKIEKKVIDVLTTTLNDGNIQIIGAWQPDFGGLKSMQEYNSDAIITIKAYPRTYETPTIPYATFQVDVSLTMRADVDAGGVSYLETTKKISDVLQEWQNKFDVFK